MSFLMDLENCSAAEHLLVTVPPKLLGLPLPMVPGVAACPVFVAGVAGMFDAAVVIVSLTPHVITSFGEVFAGSK